MGGPMDRSDLHPYQHKAIRHIMSAPKIALWMEMGLGKTASTATAIADLMDSFEVLQTLVIAPKKVARDTWPEELQLWQQSRHLEFQLIMGTPKQRLKQIQRFCDLHIIGRDLVKWLVDAWGSQWPYDMVVLDEASSFKSVKTQRFKWFKKALPYMERIVELTGTPTSKGLLDIWSQIYLLDQGKRLGRTENIFKCRYFDSDYMKYNWWPRKDTEQQIYKALEGLCLTLSVEDYLKMPRRIENRVSIELTTRLRKQYDRLEADFLLELEESGDTVKAPNSAVLTNKLLQFCNGAMYVQDEFEKVKGFQEIHSLKLDALEDLIAEAQGQSVLIAYNFKSDLKRIKARFSAAVSIDEGDDVIKRWNAGEIPILLAHPASAGHGLNLQRGGNIIVWFGLTWSLELYQQFNARLHRQGQTKPVFIHHLIVQKSIEETVMASLKNKYKTQSELLNALKEDVLRRVTHD